MRIRSGNSRDIEFIKQMLIEACFWNTRIPCPDMMEFFKNREIGKLVSGWGRTGDRAVIAEIDRRPSGAAWFRLWTESDHSYGYVSSDIPELGLGIVPQYRSQGIGRKLLRKLIDLARGDGFTGLSLSVDPANVARKLYESEGFAKAGESGTSWTYKLEL